LLLLSLGSVVTYWDITDAIDSTPVLSPEFKEFLEKVQTVEVLSIDPGFGAAPDYNSTQGFHGYKVLGKAIVRDRAVQKQIIDALRRSVYMGGLDMCVYAPTHGVVMASDKADVDVLICFSCGDMEEHSNGLGGLWMTRSSSPRYSQMHVSRARLGPILNQVLRQQGVRVSE
jgi:hypothetical protein